MRGRQNKGGFLLVVALNPQTTTPIQRLIVCNESKSKVTTLAW
jgi:hypothetical protein